MRAALAASRRRPRLPGPVGLGGPARARPDTVAACDLRLAVERSWPDASAAVGRAPEAFQRITVLSGDGAVAASRGRPMDTDREAFRAGASSFDVVVGGQRVGVLRIADGRAGELARARRRVLLLAGGAIAAISLACLALHAFHRRRIARPFAALRAFAADVAAGNLDAPLTMDRGNLFGPFTEAFDIMRDELARARRREEEAKQSKKDLVASSATTSARPSRRSRRRPSFWPSRRRMRRAARSWRPSAG